MVYSSTQNLPSFIRSESESKLGRGIKSSIPSQSKFGEGLSLITASNTEHLAKMYFKRSKVESDSKKMAYNTEQQALKSQTFTKFPSENLQEDKLNDLTQ